MLYRIAFSCVYLLSMFPYTAWSHDDLDIQIDRLTKLIQSDPSNPTLYLQRGRLFLQQTKWIKSIRDFEQCIRVGGPVAQARYNLARAWFEVGRYEYALQQAEIVLSEQSNNFRAWSIKGMILEKQLEFDEAIYCYQKAIAFRNKKIPDDYLTVIDLLDSLDEQQYLLTALQILDDGISNIGPLVVFLQKKVHIYYHLKLFNQAIQIQTQLIQTSKRKERAYFSRAQLHCSNQEFSKARLDALQARRLIYGLSPQFRNLPTTKKLLQNINLLLYQLLISE